SRVARPPRTACRRRGRSRAGSHCGGNRQCGGACAGLTRARPPAYTRADCRGDKSVDVVVCRQGKELDVAIVSRDALEELRGLFVLTSFPPLVARGGFTLRPFILP